MYLKCTLNLEKDIIIMTRKVSMKSYPRYGIGAFEKQIKDIIRSPKMWLQTWVQPMVSMRHLKCLQISSHTLWHQCVTRPIIFAEFRLPPMASMCHLKMSIARKPTAKELNKYNKLSNCSKRI